MPDSIHGGESWPKRTVIEKPDLKNPYQPRESPRKRSALSAKCRSQRIFAAPSEATTAPWIGGSYSALSASRNRKKRRRDLIQTRS